jgi:hypothetical protein
VPGPAPVFESAGSAFIPVLASVVRSYGGEGVPFFPTVTSSALASARRAVPPAVLYDKPSDGQVKSRPTSGLLHYVSYFHGLLFLLIL